MQENERRYYYRDRLRDELAARVDRNPMYSLRSFAGALGVHPGDLSQIISGKRTVSTKIVDRILSSLELTSEEKSLFLHSVIEEKRNKGLKRISPQLVSKMKLLSPVLKTLRPTPDADQASTKPLTLKYNVDPQFSREIKEKMKQFLLDVSQFPEGNDSTSVYELKLDWVPLQNSSKTKEK